MNARLLKRPSAWLPVAMSLAALLLVLAHLALSGATPQADEGTAAHLWQLLMAGQIPLVGYFALRWLPGSALRVLALQGAAALAALAPVYFLKW